MSSALEGTSAATITTVIISSAHLISNPGLTPAPHRLPEHVRTPCTLSLRSRTHHRQPLASVLACLSESARLWSREMRQTLSSRITVPTSTAVRLHRTQRPLSDSLCFPTGEALHPHCSLSRPRAAAGPLIMPPAGGFVPQRDARFRSW